MCAFSDTILGTLEPNAAGIILPALNVAFANCLPYHRHQDIILIIMIKTLELTSPQVNQIDNEVGPNKMHEIIGKGKGEREGG